MLGWRQIQGGEWTGSHFWKSTFPGDTQLDMEQSSHPAQVAGQSTLAQAAALLVVAPGFWNLAATCPGRCLDPIAALGTGPSLAPSPPSSQHRCSKTPFAASQMSV